MSCLHTSREAHITNQVFEDTEEKVPSYFCVAVQRRYTAAAKSLQSCPTLGDPMDCSLPGSMGFPRQEYWSGVPLPSPDEIYIEIFTWFK